MRKKRIKAHNGRPVKDSAPVLDPSVEKLAAVLEEIAAMDALPLIPFLCATPQKEAPMRDLNYDVRRVFGISCDGERAAQA